MPRNSILERFLARFARPPATVLHIGVPKTGTTFLQYWLARNERSLLQDGIASLSLLSAHKLAVECIADYAMSQRSDVLWLKQAKPLVHVLDECARLSSAREARTLIISSEYFTVASPTAAKTLLNRYAGPISKVIVYLRRQDHYAASYYSQVVKALGESKTFGQVGETIYTKNLDWNKLVSVWREAFPHAVVVARNYEQRRAGNALLQDFLDLIGCPLKEFEDSPVRDNPTLDSERTEVARILNERAQPFNLEHLLRIQAQDPKPPFGLSAEMTSAFESEYRRSNEALSKAFPGEFDDWPNQGWSPRGLDMWGLIGEERLRTHLEDDAAIN
jgi:hypothetical protein